MISRTTLVTIHSDGGERCFPLTAGTYVIGRDASCDLKVDSLYVSPRHARLILANDHFSVEDLTGSIHVLTAVGKRFSVPATVHLGELTLEVGEGAAAEGGTQFHALETAAASPVDSLAWKETPGSVLGHYTLVKPLGEGGFGTVWRARQERPVRREVAVKILKPGMDSREILARFDQERQALARMNHPGIARVFDAGSTAGGRPYFVMELVEGISVHRFVRRHNLTLRERLRLFIQVCLAVHHAHQKGVIHRDLKPSNILVSEVDGKPVPKIIDFGIAKAANGEKLTDFTLITQAELFVGTPAYMSPEQVSRSSGDIDTRTDIYSLGTVLYELLTGTTPFDQGELLESGYHRMLKIIQERQPERPSTRISNLAKTAGTAMDAVPHDLASLLRGDLDWIVMKCLEKERERRYGSAAALAEDLEAFLEHRPILARPPSMGYLAWRFAQRHKVVVVASAAVLVAILAGLAVSSTMYFRERDARRHADAETEKSRQVAAFLKDTLGAVDSSVALGRDTTLMRDILDQTSEHIGRELGGRPQISAELRRIMGNTYTDLRVFEPAIAQLAEATRLLRQLHPSDHPDLAACLVDHASALEMAGRVKEAEPVVSEGLAMWRRLLPPDAVEVADAECLLAWTYLKMGRAKEGEGLATHALQVWRQHPDDARLSKVANTLATIYEHTGRMKEGLDLYAEELRVLKQIYGPEHPTTANCLDNYGIHLMRMGRDQEAESILQEALTMGRKFFGDRSPHEDHVLAGLAQLAAHRGDLEAQLDYIRQCRQVGARVYPEGHRYWRESQGKYLRTLMGLTETHLDRALQPAASRESQAAAVKQAAELLTEMKAAKDLESLKKPDQPWLNWLSSVLSLAQSVLEGHGEQTAALNFARSCEAITQITDNSAIWKSRRSKANRYVKTLRAGVDRLAQSGSDVMPSTLVKRPKQ